MIRCYESTVFLIYLCRSVLVFSCYLFFFSKQKTAYEMRISDWSSDVCSSDLTPGGEKTVEYIKAQFVRIGLQPGNDGSWFQDVPMAETTADESTTLAIDVAGKTTELKFGPDMVLNTRTG